MSDTTATNEPPRLYGRSMMLRPIRERDKADRLALGRDAELVRMTGGDDAVLAPLTLGEVERWHEQARHERFLWMIDVAGRGIGVARLHRLEEANRRSRYAIEIFDPSARGRGIGTQATHLVAGYAFEALKLHRVDLRVLTFNHRAIAVYEKCGFVREGIERETLYLNGEWHSDLIMSVLEHEYQRVAL